MFCHQIECDEMEETESIEKRREVTPEAQKAMDDALKETRKRKAIEFQSRNRNGRSVISN